MDHGLFEVDLPNDNSPQSAPTPMSDVQRATIRDLFARIGVNDAKGQFAVVAELTGARISSVRELTSSDANILIKMLTSRAASAGRQQTGNSWDDREEDTWIDRL
ncbi:hypothetical protein FVP60_10930 [Microbacterium mitrae]|uniref:Uncharacterized protein n=1 Tax=Microbacterium mitrae TaxID=664640 RepID=A0A5C8HKK2_9MICO|nr:hypothetical protein [Microbacterium mitrae]TXK03396.1 hypothetical protein FVP60_10930 [Microbacterium mitrae]